MAPAAIRGFSHRWNREEAPPAGSGAFGATALSAWNAISGWRQKSQPRIDSSASWGNKVAPSVTTAETATQAGTTSESTAASRSPPTASTLAQSSPSPWGSIPQQSIGGVASELSTTTSAAVEEHLRRSASMHLELEDWSLQEREAHIVALGVVNLPGEEVLASVLADAIGGTPLPEPWQLRRARNGEVFFRNPVMKEAVWSHPLQAALTDLAGVCRVALTLPLHLRGEAVDRMRQHWEGEARSEMKMWYRVRPKGGQEYYAHRETGLTMWERPTAAILPAHFLKTQFIAKLLDEDYLATRTPSATSFARDPVQVVLPAPEQHVAATTPTGPASSLDAAKVPAFERPVDAKRPPDLEPQSPPGQARGFENTSHLSNHSPPRVMSPTGNSSATSESRTPDATWRNRAPAIQITTPDDGGLADADVGGIPESPATQLGPLAEDNYRLSLQPPQIMPSLTGDVTKDLIIQVCHESLAESELLDAIEQAELEEQEEEDKVDIRTNLNTPEVNIAKVTDGHLAKDAVMDTSAMVDNAGDDNMGHNTTPHEAALNVVGEDEQVISADHKQHTEEVVADVPQKDHLNTGGIVEATVDNHLEAEQSASTEWAPQVAQAAESHAALEPALEVVGESPVGPETGAVDADTKHHSEEVDAAGIQPSSSGRLDGAVDAIQENLSEPSPAIVDGAADGSEHATGDSLQALGENAGQPAVELQLAQALHRLEQAEAECMQLRCSRDKAVEEARQAALDRDSLQCRRTGTITEEAKPSPKSSITMEPSKDLISPSSSMLVDTNASLVDQALPTRGHVMLPIAPRGAAVESSPVTPVLLPIQSRSTAMEMQVLPAEDGDTTRKHEDADEQEKAPAFRRASIQFRGTPSLESVHLVDLEAPANWHLSWKDRRLAKEGSDGLRAQADLSPVDGEVPESRLRIHSELHALEDAVEMLPEACPDSPATLIMEPPVPYQDPGTSPPLEATAQPVEPAPEVFAVQPLSPKTPRKGPVRFMDGGTGGVPTELQRASFSGEFPGGNSTAEVLSAVEAIAHVASEEVDKVLALAGAAPLPRVEKFQGQLVGDPAIKVEAPVHPAAPAREPPSRREQVRSQEAMRADALMLARRISVLKEERRQTCKTLALAEEKLQAINTALPGSQFEERAAARALRARAAVVRENMLNLKAVLSNVSQSSRSSLRAASASVA